MENLDLLVLRRLLQWRQAGQRALLATVTRTWGSSPRPVGSIMALRQGGAVVGSVSGGCIEDDLVHRFAPAVPDGPPQRLTYGVSADEAHRFGLPCGGTLELALEFNPDADALAALVAALDAGHMRERSIRWPDGSVFSHRFGPAWRLLLIGAGQLGEYLATMALFNGFAVTVCDPRDEYRSSWSLAQVDWMPGMPDDAVLAMRPDARSAIVALTHDPKLDDMALLEALLTDAFYVGAIGSRRNQATRRERLQQHFDLPPERLARLRGPIGIHIGSKTPAEIAVSVMAEILAVRNGVRLPGACDVGTAKAAADAALRTPR